MYVFLGKIWKDPVWSKVIATGVIAMIAFSYEVITKKSLFSWLSNLIPVWWLLLTIILMLFLFWIRNRWIATASEIIIPKTESVYIEKIKEFNTLNIGTVQWRWEVEVSAKRANPTNFTAYCMKHDEIGSLFVPNERLGERLKCIRCNSYIPTEPEFLFGFDDSNHEGRELPKPDAIQRIIVEFDKHLQLVNREYSNAL
ncbi:MAG TPA: hypothetical protein VFG10_17765 [Saprospiraceae bacterium]|nr:hypothetical protein [Saprospiraceae bacterium]